MPTTTIQQRTLKYYINRDPRMAVYMRNLVPVNEQISVSEHDIIIIRRDKKKMDVPLTHLSTMRRLDIIASRPNRTHYGMYYRVRPRYFYADR